MTSRSSLHAWRRWSTAVCAAALVATQASAGSDLPNSKAKTARPSLYVVGYSHLDTEWCWSYPQVIREFIPNTLNENFALFKKYPDYVFNWTGSNRYRFMKEYYPAEYAQLKKYVAQGRWFTAGSSVEEGDVNSPSEESLVRQVMYGNEYFEKEFGTRSSEYMLPDCFGFPASLPSILAHCGLKGFSTQKLTWGSAVGIPFNVGKWVGPDGNYIVAALNAEAYDSDVRTDLATDPHWIARMKQDVVKDGVGVDYHYYGVGDRGGAPDAESVGYVQQSVKTPGPVHVFAGRADQMFNDLSPEDVEKLPKYKGDLELTQHSAGSLTSESEQKRWNRKNELLANETESASVAANWIGAVKYDKTRITDAWLRFLPGQFHDLMAGTALPVSYNYSWNDEVIAMNEFADVLQNSIGGVSRALDTRTKGVALTVYNPLSVERNDVVEASVRFPGSVPLNVQVFDSSGQPIPTQVISRSERDAKIAFVGKVPSLGYAVFDVRTASGGAEPSGLLSVSSTGLENGRYRVKVDAAGDVSSVYDKVHQKELLSGPARLACMHENPKNWPAWNMDWSDQKQPPRDYVSGKPLVEVVEDGPVRVGLRITRRFKGSKFIQTLRLSSGDAADRLDFVTQIDWQGKETALKAEFPLTVSNPKATYNWGLGTIMRGNDDPKKYEVASHGWMDLTNEDKSYGASVLEDSKYGSDKPNDNTLRLTLLYTPGINGGYQHQATQDWGRSHITYSLMGHANSWESGNTQWESAELNQPLVAFQSAQHAGALGTSLSLASTSNKDVSIEALKQAEAGDEVVVRLNELAGEVHNGVQVKFGAPILSAREIDGQERTIGKANVASGVLQLDVKAYEPRAFALKIGKAPVKLNPASSSPLALPYNLIGISSGFGAHDANFDGAGNSIPGDLIPDKVEIDGVDFKIGPKGQKDIVVPDGQSIKLPAGTHRKLYLLGSSAKHDGKLQLSFGSESHDVNLQAWDGFVGQWDTRLWGGDVPELTYSWHNPMIGLVPGFIKRQPVAWYADHKRKADGSNDFYAFCYLFKTVINVPDGATEVTLGKNDDARIAAITVAQNPNDGIRPVQPLYDVLEHENVDGPSLSVSEPISNAEQIVTIDHPLYWSSEAPLRYTLDGSMPTLQSQVYSRPFALGTSSTITVASVDPSGKATSVSKRSVTINDTVAPTIESAVALPGGGTTLVKIVFNEEVDKATAENPANYSVEGVGPASAATLSEDGKQVSITVAAGASAATSLTVKGVDDAGGVAVNATVPISSLAPVFTDSDALSFDGKGAGFTQRDVDKLPLKGNAAWTINMFVKPSAQPGALTIVGGFGSGGDSEGAERFIIANRGHIYFWGSNIDVDSGVAYDVDRWQMITATYDGKTIRLFKDGKLIKSEANPLKDAEPMVRLAPPPAWEDGHKFQGQIGGITIWNEALPAEFLSKLLAGEPK